MDILAGMLAYVAGLGALFGAVAVAFVMFAATPKGPSEQSLPQSAMLLRSSTLKTDVSKTGAKLSRSHSQRHGAALPSAAQPTASREVRSKASTAQARRPIQ